MWRAHEEAAAAAASSPATGTSTSAPTSRTSSSTSQPSARASASDSMWTFDASSTGATAKKSSNHGVIGSGNVHAASRFLWSRMGPEEEEREEEALPSYLSYLQPAFSSSGGGSLAAYDDPLRRHSTSGGAPPNLGNPATTLPFIPASAQQSSSALHLQQQQQQQQRMYGGTSRQYNQQQSYSSHHSNGSMANAMMATGGSATDHASVQVESKSREFANALQEFILTQMEEQQQQLIQQQQHKQTPPGLAPSGANGSMSSSSASACKCEPLKVRVSELEHQLQTLQVQVTSLLNSGMGNTSTPGSSGGGHSATAIATGGIQPPLPGGPSSLSSMAMAQMPMSMGMAQQPPLPPGQLQQQQQLSPSSSSSQLPTGVGSAMSDRVSTLEGRQSAFQSQLAQISKVLGVPVGKHGKNSQVKTLVQTLREEIDIKVVQATTELETKCVESVKEQLETVVENVTREELQAQLGDIVAATASSSSSVSASSSPSTLSYETVLGALAEEHEASLTKLSTYFEERLVQESKQRVGLESRIQARFGEQEEWLQQLEGEFGSWHDTSSSVAAQIRVIQNKIAEVEEKWRSDLLKWSKLSSESHHQHASTLSNSAESSSVSPTSSGGAGSGAKAKHKGNNAASGNSASLAAQQQQQQTNANNGTGMSAFSADTFSRTVHQLQVQFKHFQSEYKTDIAELRENLALMETWVKTTRQEGRDLAKNAKGMKQLVEKLVRDTGSAEELLQQYVSTITHQVASVTRQYVSVRIRDNNRLIDATLRARVPAYVENESESFMLVRPEKKESAAEDSSSSGASASSSQGVVLREDDEEGIRKLLASQLSNAQSSANSSSNTAATSSLASVPTTSS
ncbi:hypothetical protein Gpo141_00010150 [Globisporangium polare]